MNGVAKLLVGISITSLRDRAPLSSEVTLGFLTALTSRLQEGLSVAS